LEIRIKNGRDDRDAISFVAADPIAYSTVKPGDQFDTGDPNRSAAQHRRRYGDERAGLRRHLR
jgi:hypothetical protein